MRWNQIDKAKFAYKQNVFVFKLLIAIIGDIIGK